eukprot:5627559-Prymnesium_polylepis.1
MWPYPAASRAICGSYLRSHLPASYPGAIRGGRHPPAIRLGILSQDIHSYPPGYPLLSAAS